MAACRPTPPTPPSFPLRLAMATCPGRLLCRPRRGTSPRAVAVGGRPPAQTAHARRTWRRRRLPPPPRHGWPAAGGRGGRQRRRQTAVVVGRPGRPVVLQPPPPCQPPPVGWWAAVAGRQAVAASPSRRCHHLRRCGACRAAVGAGWGRGSVVAGAEGGRQTALRSPRRRRLCRASVTSRRWGRRRPSRGGRAAAEVRRAAKAEIRGLVGAARGGGRARGMRAGSRCGVGAVEVGGGGEAVR